MGRLRVAVGRLAVLTQARVRTGRSHDDADEATGTVDTDDAHGFDPLPLLQALHEHGARVAVIGQVAGIMHGSQELTGDLDLLWDGASEQAPALAAAFGSMTASLTDDDGVPVACTPAAFALPKVLFRCPRCCGDCCTPALSVGRAADCRLPGPVPRRHRSGGLRDPLRRPSRPDLDAPSGRRAKDLRRAKELERLAGLAV